MDFTKLRAAALSHGDDEEAVTVNTRALIDKVLARYSGEWTTLRELIQNAADAQATSVTIKFETLPSASVPLSNTTSQSEVLKHVLLHHTLRRLLVTNDGQKFGVNDWSRLKRIAEGNPDETKIGAFGVGFYSVFADCEDPFVSSGDQAMAFYWKGNSLFTKRLQLPDTEGNPNTSFVLDYRNTTTPMPNLLSIAQFLATSLTFVALQKIELFVDDWKIVSLVKKTAPSVEVPIARDVETRTKEGLMKVTGMDRESVQMDATFMNVVGWKPSVSASFSKPGFDSTYGSNDVPSLRSFFSRLTSSASHAQLRTKQQKEEKAFQEIVLEDVTALTTVNVFLRVTTAVVKTSIGVSFSAELERATKKPPPKTTKMAILTSSYDETAASEETAVTKGVDIFSSVLPGKKGGRIFIGFPTHQTTGAGMHLSAPSVIPTVERESIDLNARWVRTWNQEMLRVAGIMSRLAFSNEMADLSEKVKRAAKDNDHGTKVSKQEIDQFMAEAIHTLKTFTFEESTPSSQVSQIIEEAFWTAYKKPSIEIYSTRGVLPTTQVRLATEDLSGFVEGIPVVPDDLVKCTLVNKLRDFGLITEITISDVKKELEAKALTKTQLIQFITWAGRKAITGDIEGSTISSLMDVAVAMTGDAEGTGEIVALGTITNYLDVNKIPPDVPLPPSTIPFEFTKTSKTNELQALGWDTLEIVPWLRFLIENNANRPVIQSLNQSSQFAAKVLQILSKAWDGLSAGSKETVTDLLKSIAIVPTKAGMKKPGEAFFEKVKLFDDLPTVVNCPGVKEKFFAAIGVRKTVDLETIFKRLLAPQAEPIPGQKAVNYRHMEVIKYLTSVRDDIPNEDMRRLKDSRFVPAEAGPAGMESTQGSDKLYKVSELFVPSDHLRQMRLPILQWPGPPGSYRPGSAEGRFLSFLGLRAFPSVPELVGMMSSGDAHLRDKARDYFISNHHLNSYTQFEIGSSKELFLPLKGDPNRLVSPAECFTNEDAAILGFNILRKDLQVHANKFGVAMNPPMTECVNRLIAKPPRSKGEAITLFKYFADRLGELGQNSVAKLADARIVPVTSQPQSNGYSSEKSGSNQKSDLRLLTPRNCYIGHSEAYGTIFEFVDFGTFPNAFLTKCGSKNGPTILEIADLVASEPARLLGIMQSPEKYMALLRKLADELSELKRDKLLLKKLKSSQCLLGSIEIASNDENPKKLKSLGIFDIAGDSDQEDYEDAPIKTFQLALANQIVVNDDYAGYRLFKRSLICAPEDEKLEKFYEALGSQSLSSLIRETLRTGNPTKNQQAAQALEERVQERTKLFLHEHTRDAIHHDSRWLAKNLSVVVVDSINLRRSLLGGYNQQHTEKRAAAIEHEGFKGWTLYIAPGPLNLYQISQALCKLLLRRPTQSSYLTFESFLGLTLLDLRARGYNVDRILRAQAAQARIAEEERKKQLAAEQQRIREQEQQWQQQGQVVPAAAARVERNRKSENEHHMPGAFDPDSPECSPEEKPKDRQRATGLFSGLKTRLLMGNNFNGDVQEQLQNFLGGGGGASSQHHQHEQQQDVPPSYDESNRSATKPPGTSTEKVSSPAAVQQNLLNAIQSSRAHDSSTLFSPPTTQTIKEQSTYCDSTPSTNISFLATTSNSTRIFVSKYLSATTPQRFLSENVKSLNAFANLLQEIGEVYTLDRKAVHIFYDEHGGTIAFNSNGSLFCNFRFWGQLHEGKVMGGSGEGKVEAAAYWWIVVAHELAHNLVKAHNSDHSFYTEMLVAHYFPKMMAKAAGYLEAQPKSQLQPQSQQRRPVASQSSGSNYSRGPLSGERSLLD